MEERDRRGVSYEDDVYGWSRHQAALLRQGRYDDVDMENVAEEIERVGRSQVASLRSCYRLIAAHLLKVLFQPERFTRSWQGTVVRERFNASAYLDENLSLEPRRADIFAEAYAQARRLASAETGMGLEAFPADAPFSWEQASSEDYQPWTALAEPPARGA